MKKKLMILGGSRYIVPIIKKAHELGLYVITCDYLPNNVAHRYSDQYVNVSIIDKDAVLLIAKELRIDGIISFACDPGVVTAAYVAEELDLPFQCSFKSAEILQDKGLFRSFLRENGFNTPNAKKYLNNIEPFSELDLFNWPVIVKPTDSAGSKGVSRVDSVDQLGRAIESALSESHKKSYIIEDFITFDGFHSSTDPFTIDGMLDFITYSDQLFDAASDNAYTPAYIVWPSTMDKSHQNYLTGEIQRLMNLLGMRSGIYNIESCVGTDGKPYIMEVSPRGGGCKIAEIQEMAMGVELIENEIRSAVELPLKPLTKHDCDGVWCEMIIHAHGGQEGVLKEINIAEDIEHDFLILTDYAVKPGDIIHPFTGANMALGDAFFHFKNRTQMEQVLQSSNDWLRIETE